MDVRRCAFELCEKNMRFGLALPGGRGCGQGIATRTPFKVLSPKASSSL